jgi:2-iminobutanoate/2-iminopropanoate deaminase
MTGPASASYHPFVGMKGLPFSEVVRVGNLLFLSGQLGLDADGRLVPGGIGPETRRTLENIRAVLERHGSSLDRIVKVTVMLADIEEWGEMNLEYTQVFTGNLPARSAFGTSGLALGARVEIECVALGEAATRSGGRKVDARRRATKAKRVRR